MYRQDYQFGGVGFALTAEAPIRPAPLLEQFRAPETSAAHQIQCRFAARLPAPPAHPPLDTPEEKMWSRVHGIVYPDGTIRDPSIVAAIMGFFRNRSDSAILPDVNQEHFADKALENAGKLLHAYAPADELLEACENMANLLEAGELVPMAYPPTRKIEEWRRKEKKDIMAIRQFTFSLMETLRQACQIG